MPLLEVTELTVDFGTERALGGLSFGLEPGDRLAVVGEAGAGKTLLGLGIIGLLPRAARFGGSVALEGKPLPSGEALMALRGRRIGMAFQDAEHSFDPLRRIGGELHAAARRSRDAVTPAMFDQLIDDLGLPRDRLAAFPDELSASERQLALLAATLLPGPDLLIADEPGGGLDPVARRRVLDLIATLSDRRKMAVVLLTREPRAAALLCRQVLVLRDGKVADSGRTDAVLARPRDEYTRTLVAAGKPRARALMRSPIGADLLDVRHVTRAHRAPGVTGLWRKAPPVLKDVSFTVKTAEAVAVVGTAGAGKSSLARIIAGLDRADNGEMVFERLTYRGRDLPRDFRAEIALVTGDAAASVDPRLTGLEAVSEPLHLSTIEPGGWAARAAGAMATVGLTRDSMKQRIGELSPIDALRLALARALVVRPRLLLLDTPIEALDLRPRGDLLNLIARLRADLGLTLLIFTRDIETVRSLADRVLVLDKGEIVDTGRPADLFQTQRHATTAALLRARLPELG